ncbi:MAG: VWA domain-containing protein [Proteobacteria bacterium]|nr:VWA domain-containing protein [Pseudomonadota bacterium]
MGGRKINRAWLSIAVAAVIVTGVWHQASAESSKSDLVFVLDGSGSMWGRVAGEMKIVAAKKVMVDLLRDIPAGVEVGLVAYGHRRRGDCTDIQTIAPIGTDPAAISVAVSGITPRGKTPITESLKQAADLLSGRDAPATVVLVSDGIESCQGDPCALARTLAAQDAKLVIHTVGLGVGSKAAAQLQCVAKAAGGNYYHAADTAALRKALFAVRDAVARQEKPPAPPPAPEVKKTDSKILKILGPGTIVLKPAPWVKMPAYYWKILDAETGEVKGQAKQTRLRAGPGEYQIMWRQTQYDHNDIPLSAVVDLRAGKTVDVPIDTGLQITVPKGIEAPYWWSLTRPDEEKASVVVSGRLGPQVVPAGRYELHWRQVKYDSPTVALGTVDIAAGKLNQHLLGSGVRFTIADWVPGAPYYIALLDSDGTALGRWSSDTALQPQLVRPGTYRAFYRQSQYSHSDIPLGEVDVPERGFAEVSVNSGVRFKPQEGIKPPYQAIFVSLGGGEEYVWDGREYGEWAPVPLPPGRYRLDWQEEKYDSQRMTLVDEFEIEPGMLVEFEM